MKMINQNKLTGALMLIILGCFLLGGNVSGQSLKVHIKVNSTVGMHQSIPYETILENKMQATSKSPSSQPHSINGLGAFTMTGKENTNILIRLDAPEVLVNKENQTTPYQMKLAWQNNISNDVSNLNWSNKKSNVFKLSRSLNATEKNVTRNDDMQASIYLKGTAEVPDNAQSPFEGNIKLTIEY